MHRKKMFFVTIGLVCLVALMGIAPVEARDSSVYKKNGAAAQQKNEAATQQKAATGAKFATFNNLVIFSSRLWVVLRYDAASNSLTVTASDSSLSDPLVSEAAVWFDPEPIVTGNTISATCSLISGDPLAWVDTLFYDIVIRGGTAFIYESTSDDPVTFLYRGRAVRITF
jgi:hypothetical protein